MLLRFGCSNFRSIREYQELSFSNAPLKDPGASLLRVDGLDTQVLPAIAIYGANASGKSNFLKALRFLVGGILHSHTKPRDDAMVARDYFKLDPSSKDSPSKFDLDIVLAGTRYHYGIVYGPKGVQEEWLYAFPLSGPRRSRQTWFHRKAGEAKEFYFGKELKGKNKTIQSLTRNDSLFLSTAAQNNHPQLLPLVKYFSSQMIFRDSEYEPGAGKIAGYLKDGKLKAPVLAFLAHADIGLTDAEVSPLKKDAKRIEFLNAISEVIQKHAGVVLPPDEEELFDLVLKHRAKHNESVSMRLSDESQGTVALLGILGPVFEALAKGNLLILDELNSSIHPLVSREIIRLFNSAESNKGGGQLLFSTHDTNLLCRGVLRRDQIWFTEKGPDGATALYPLTDIKTRQTDNIEKGYLEGRFGAVPFFGADALP